MLQLMCSSNIASGEGIQLSHSISLSELSDGTAVAWGFSSPDDDGESHSHGGASDSEDSSGGAPPEIWARGIEGVLITVCITFGHIAWSLGPSECGSTIILQSPRLSRSVESAEPSSSVETGRGSAVPTWPE